MFLHVSFVQPGWDGVIRPVLAVTSHQQMFPGKVVTFRIITLHLTWIRLPFLGKPPYQRMTSVCPLPSYMSGYLHQLGGHASGVYRQNL